MKLSEGEKLMLLMLCDIYEKTETDGEFNPEFIRSAIEEDQLWAINWACKGSAYEKTELPEPVLETLSILDMWWLVEDSYYHLNDSNKEELKRDLNVKELPTFIGFDMESEEDYVSLSIFLINWLDKYRDFHGREVNSRFPCINDYRRMVAVLESMKHDPDEDCLSLKQIKKILHVYIPNMTKH